MLSDQPVGNSALPTGEFAVEFPEAGKPFSGTVIRGGELFMDTYIFPSYVIYESAEGDTTDYLIVTDGNVSIAKTDEGYSFDMELIGTLVSDDSEATLSHSWSGEVEFVDIYGDEQQSSQNVARHLRSN
ncbi:MAG: hypothetical protein IJ979_02130 [Tidjanibacter sp.]|nr:hypothetical protein [Tidjanibacter sp.]